MRPLGIVGNLSCDRVDDRPPRVGGPPYYAARALRVLGHPAVVATKLADEDRPLLLPPLIATGAVVHSRAAETTAGFTIRYSGDTREMSVDAIGDPWAPEDVEDWVEPALGRARWVHVGAIARSDFPPGTLAALARGRRLSFDAQGLVRPSRTGPLEPDADFDRKMLRHVTVLKLAEEEAQVILGKIDAGSLRSLEVPEVLVTFGSRGSLVYADGRLERVPAHPLSADPTGAGDAFATGYLAARSVGQAPAAAARRATALVAALLR